MSIKNTYIDMKENPETQEKTMMVNERMYLQFMKFQNKKKEYMKKYIQTEKGKLKSRSIQRKYYQKHKQRLKEKRDASRIHCPTCDKMIRPRNIDNHKLTKYHIKRLDPNFYIELEKKEKEKKEKALAKKKKALEKKKKALEKKKAKKNEKNL